MSASATTWPPTPGTVLSRTGSSTPRISPSGSAPAANMNGVAARRRWPAPSPVLRSARPGSRRPPPSRPGSGSDCADGTVPCIEFCRALDVLPGTALTILMVMRARCESGTGFNVVLDIVVPRAFDGPVARNDLSWLVGLGRRRALGAARHQRRRRLQQVLGELPLAGKQLLGEVVGAGHGALWLRLQQVLGELPLAGKQLLGEVVSAGQGVFWPGQLVREGHTDGRQLGKIVRKRRINGRQLRTGCPDGFGQVPDHGDHGLLALTDDGQELFLAGGASHCLGLLVSFC